MANIKLPNPIVNIPQLRGLNKEDVDAFNKELNTYSKSMLDNLMYLVVQINKQFYTKNEIDELIESE